MKKHLTKTTTLLILLSTINLKAQKTLDDIVNPFMSTHKIPGLVIAIVQNDSVTTLQAYGLADVQNNSLIKVKTTFELGSLSKQFTAVAILKLQQEGKLNVDDFLYSHFSECPQLWKDIKIKHLLWHTSGLPGMYPHDSFSNKSFTGYTKMNSYELDLMMQTNNVSKEISIKSIVSDSLDSKPGSSYNYSDVGYLMLGIVIDNITGSYKNYMMNIFSQCNMPNTYLIDQEKVVINQARGYSLKNGELINIMRTWDYEIPSYFGVFSNAEDLIKWNMVINGDDFLIKSNKMLLFSKGKLDNNAEIAYGCGWEINDINGMRFISHTGVTGTSLVNIPNKKTTVIVLTNLGYNGNDFVNPWNLSYEIINNLGIETRINRNHITSNGYKQIRTNKSIFKKLSGTYFTTDGIEAKIYLEKGKEFFECQGSKNEISQLENGSWLVLGFDYEYILSLDKSGKILTSNYGRKFNRN